MPPVEETPKGRRVVSLDTPVKAKTADEGLAGIMLKATVGERKITRGDRVQGSLPSPMEALEALESSRRETPGGRAAREFQDLLRETLTQKQRLRFNEWMLEGMEPDEIAGKRSITRQAVEETLETAMRRLEGIGLERETLMAVRGEIKRSLSQQD